jgi:hypothetical protein
MEAYAGKKYVGIDLHREQVEYPNVRPGYGCSPAHRD